MTTRAAKSAARITPTEFARRLGISKQAVSQAVKAGRITLGSDRKLDEKSARKQWRDNTDQSKPRNSVTGKPKKGDAAKREKPDPNEKSYASSRAKREEWAAKTAELEYQEKAGALVAIADVVADAEDRLVRAKNASYDAASQYVPAVLQAKDEPAARAALLGCLGVFFDSLTKGVDDEDAPGKKAGRRDKA